MDLPDRDAVESALSQMLDSAALTPGQDPPERSSAPRAGVYVIAVDGHERLIDLDTDGAGVAMGELARRLDRLVRAADVLGRLGADRFALVTASIAPSFAGAVIERIEGAAALPLEIGGRPISLSVTVGVAFGAPGREASTMLTEAEDDIARIRSR